MASLPVRISSRVCGFTRLGVSILAMSCLGFPVVAFGSCPPLASGASEAASILSFQESVARLSSHESMDRF